MLSKSSYEFFIKNLQPIKFDDYDLYFNSVFKPIMSNKIKSIFKNKGDNK